jgi:DNA-binding GntR family transcriptional regulator
VPACGDPTELHIPTFSTSTSEPGVTLMHMTQTGSEATNVLSVYDELRRSIVDGATGPGTRLVEGTLAKSFGVSRTPVREALNRLAYEGLVERHDRAMRVRVLNPEEVLHLYEVRIALERAAARAAAERRTDLDARSLEQITERMQSLDEHAIDERPSLAHSFHFRMWQASHNPAMIQTLENVHVRVRSLSSTTLHYQERWETFRNECVSLSGAVTARNIEEAGRIAELQMINARDYRLHLYTSQRGNVT